MSCRLGEGCDGCDGSREQLIIRHAGLMGIDHEVHDALDQDRHRGRGHLNTTDRTQAAPVAKPAPKTKEQKKQKGLSIGT